MKLEHFLIITDPPKILLFFLCNILNVAVMYQNITVEAAKIVDVMQGERNRALGWSVIR